jgi:hypothetical protein
MIIRVVIFCTLLAGAIFPATRAGGPPPSPHRGLIEDMTATVSSNSIDAAVLRLQEFGTRWALHDSCRAASHWIASRFAAFGMDTVRFHRFSDRYSDNVVAVKTGKSEPDKVVIIGGHYDSVSNNAYIAPGADDNGSGTAVLLECARVLGGYQFDRTIRFVAFSAEEQGLKGSESYAAEAAARGDDIVAMINVDMVGYLADGDALDLDVISDTQSVWLRDRVFGVAAAYVPGFDLVDGDLTPAAGSDHVPFRDRGYDAIMLYEDSEQWSPFMHTTGDSVGTSYNSPELAEGTARVAVALVADLAGPRPGTRVPPVVLDQNYPNPFNPDTRIRFHVSPPGLAVSLTVYDAAGRLVKTLLENVFVAGEKTVAWDGTNSAGEPAPSGVYFCRLAAGASFSTRKMSLVR